MDNVFSLWLVLLSFVSFAGSYEGPKVMLFWIGGLFLTIYWIGKIVQKSTILSDRSLVFFGAWIGILAISSVFGVHPYNSLIGGSYRHQGLIFFITLGMVSLYLVQKSKDFGSRLSNLLSYSTVLQSMTIIYQYMFLHITKPIGTIGESNAASGFLAIGIYWILKNSQIHTYLKMIFICLIIAAIFLTQSRSGLIMTTFICIIYSIRYLNTAKSSTVSIGIIFGILLSAIVLGYVQIRKITIVHPVSSVESRSVMASVGMIELVKKPFIGYGAESGERIYDTHFKRISMPLADFMIDRSHILFLDVALWSGIFGLSVFCFWIYIRLRAIYRTGDIFRCSNLLIWIFFACLQPIGVVHWVQLILIMYLV